MERRESQLTARSGYTFLASNPLFQRKNPLVLPYMDASRVARAICVVMQKKSAATLYSALCAFEVTDCSITTSAGPDAYPLTSSSSFRRAFMPPVKLRFSLPRSDPFHFTRCCLTTLQRLDHILSFWLINPGCRAQVICGLTL